MQLNSIYRQSLLKIVLPVIIGLVIIGVFSYKNIQIIHKQHNEIENLFIYNEVKSLLELQFLFLSKDESDNDKIKHCNNKLLNNYLRDVEDIKSLDLLQIKEEFCTDSTIIDINILNKKGEVVNTSIRNKNSKKTSNINYNKYIVDKFSKSEFAITDYLFNNRWLKYSYQKLDNDKYILSIKQYSSIANKLLTNIINYTKDISNYDKDISSIDIFLVISGRPYSINNKKFIEQHISYIPQIIKNNKIIIANYTYTYIPYYKTASPVNGAIVCVINNNLNMLKFIKGEIFKIITVLLILIVIIYILTFVGIKKIILPINKLITQTKKVANGNYLEQVKVEGNNELTILSNNFNKMVDSIKERNLKIEEQSEFLYSSNKKLNEAYKILEHQKQVIESKQYDLTDSINYALHIQESLIPNPNSFADVFKDSFVYILPRDIVSGDFYWFSNKRNKVVINLSDCTGHGVPGAFMSMIGITILNHLVNYEHIDDPALILSRLDSEICNLLIYNNTKEQRFEGMDSAICTIDFSTDELVFSSAKRPILLIRDNEVITYKGSIYPIGEYYDNVQKIFTNKTIKLKEGDIIYMFSDGYTSQFNENDKKINTRRFKKILTEISQKPVKEHPAILNRVFDAWKGNTEQIDDVLILAFKYTKESHYKTISAKELINAD